MEQVQRFLTDSTEPFERLACELPHQEIWPEMWALRDLAVVKQEPHSEGWSKLCLHGHGLYELRSYLDYTGAMAGFDRRYRWSDEIRDQIPHTMRFFERFRPFDHLRRIRLQWLAPGGYIRAHRDVDHGTERRITVNIAVNNPEGCEMRFGDRVVPFQAGDAYVLDTTQEHSVHNDSDQHRAHLVLDGA
jgi:hypothetical protein